MTNDMTGTLHLTEDELTFLLELVNNERYTSNSNSEIASTLFTALSRDLRNVRLAEEEFEAEQSWDAVSQ